MKSREEVLSRYLSNVLRHNAHKKGLSIRPDGYALAKDILALKDCKQNGSGPRFSMEEIISVVENNSKQRFHLYTDEKDGQTWVRANQGHSMEGISVEMKEIKAIDCSRFPIVVHGTYRAAWENIRKQGLSRCKRQHIHFSKGNGAVSGMRGNCQVLIYIDLASALDDGFQFFESANGVILTAGDKDGFLPFKYFSAVEDAESGENLLGKDQ